MNLSELVNGRRVDDEVGIITKHIGRWKEPTFALGSTL